MEPYIESLDLSTDKRFKHYSHKSFEDFLEGYAFPNNIVILFQSEDLPII